MDKIQLGKNVIEIEVEALKSLGASLGCDFEEAIDAILACLDTNSKLVLTGIGKSGNISQKIAATFTSTGTPAVVLNHVDALHGDLGIIQSGDVILVLSFSGESDEIGQFLPALKRFSNTMIVMTGNRDSTIAKSADIIIPIPVKNEACPFNLAPTASTTAMLAMGDALAICLLKIRGFTEKDFALYHPSGAIGRRLLMKIKDVMRSDRQLAVSPPEMSVRQALNLMTNAKAGCICITNQDGALTGIFTDGDLRRHILSGESLLDRPIGSVMTPDPIKLDQDALAVEALKIFDEHQIDDLVIVDSNSLPVGIVDSQDLPKIKLL